MDETILTESINDIKTMRKARIPYTRNSFVLALSTQNNELIDYIFNDYCPCTLKSFDTVQMLQYEEMISRIYQNDSSYFKLKLSFDKMMNTKTRSFIEPVPVKKMSIFDMINK